MGKILIITGAVFLLTGIIMLFADKIPFLGNLPGDIYIRKGRTAFYFPLVTGLILPFIVTVILNLFGRGK
nr:DUF2905 domain-containing protein [candidate division Zixibacteria bacterium]